MMYIALYKVSIHTNILNVLCISTKSMKIVFTYSNRTFTDVAKLFPYDSRASKISKCYNSVQSKKGGQITSQLELKEINLGCSYIQ